MASTETIPESGKKKSGVVQSQNPNKRDPAFEIGDPVKMVVRETWVDGITRRVNKEFIVDDRRCARGHWEYRLRIAPNGGLWDGGGWFPETSLKAG